MAKPQVRFTDTQELRQWTQRLSLESHHESNLPSSRYKARDSLPPRHNPIAPEGIPDEVLNAPEPPGFTQALRKQPTPVGNPLMGFSTHPLPLPLLPQESSTIGAYSKTNSSSAAARARLAELQASLEQERRLRKDLESKISAVRSS